MKKCSILLILLGTVLPFLLFAAPNRANAAQNRSAVAGRLETSENGRYFVRDGKPFFWLGDSAWSLLSLYTPAEAREYLDHRSRQGFTVIHIMIPFDGGPGLKTSGRNPNGELPFHDWNPLKPNEAYFKNMDALVDAAQKDGLILYILPLGGSGGSFVDKLHVFTKQNARAYGEWLGRRYRDKPNIVWMDGFDLEPWRYRDIADEFVAGLQAGDRGAHLISYAPGGGFSSSYFQNEPWLSFDHIQVWNDYWRAYSFVVADYCRLPVKPVVMAEGAYEAGTEYASGPITPLIVRKEAYWSYLGGGFHTYGHNDIWRKNPDWRESLDSPGARQLGILERLLAAHEWWKLVPDQSVFARGAGSDETQNVAARSTDGDLVIAYLASPAPVSVDLHTISAAKTVRATLVNPETGEETSAGVFSHDSIEQFSAPAGSTDAVLVLQAQ
ncbi:MAG: DUF4038 domain-containing protein [Terracidiphilus sp.]|jgi:hypothetical protein